MQFNKLSRKYIAYTLFLLLFQASSAFGQIKIVTSFTILADMAQNIAGDHAEIISITKAGAEIHGYSPTPRDLYRAQDADLILWNGLNLEIWFEQFFETLPQVPVIRLSENIIPISVRSGDYEGSPNPHAWMGEENAMIYVDNIVKALSEYDPDRRLIYEENAKEYKQKITNIFSPLKAQLADLPESQKWLVTCEGAFSYLAHDLGLKELYLWPMNADQTGTPQQIRYVIDQIKQHQIPAIFCESTANTAPAEQIARETGAHYGGVLYVDSLSLKDGPVPTYLDLLTLTTQRIIDALMLNFLPK